MTSSGGATGLNLREDERMYFGGLPKAGRYRYGDVHSQTEASDVIEWIASAFNIVWDEFFVSHVSSGQRWFWRATLAVWKTLKFPERRTICWAAQTTQDWSRAAPLRYSETIEDTMSSFFPSSLLFSPFTVAQIKRFSLLTWDNERDRAVQCVVLKPELED